MLDEFVPTTIRTACGEVEFVESGAGPAVLAVHGSMGGWDQSLLLAQAAGLKNQRVIALSRPGFLGTPLASGRSAEAQAELYAATLDALGIDRAAVIAISGGGPSAIKFALQYPDRCWALVLVSTVGEPLRRRVPWSFHFKLLFARLGWMFQWLGYLIDPKLDVAARRAIRNPQIRARTLADPQSGPLFRELLASIGRWAAKRASGTKQDILVAGAPVPPLEEVRVPTLVIHGTDDPILPFAHNGVELSRRIPGAELLAIEGGEHFCIFSHCREIRARVKTFLDAHAPVAVQGEIPQH